MKTKRNTGLATFSERMVHLISETNFIRFEQVLSEPNIFKIVGRSHYERWHSCFWGWLLDPNGTHLLKNYPLLRLLLLLSDERTLKSNGKCKLLQNLPAIEFTDVEVTPNEFVSTERSVEGVGRFDIFLTAKYTNRIHSHHTGFWKNAGMIGLTLPHGRDEKENNNHSSGFETESAAADWQSYS